jgi:hypothetical protein
MKLTNTSWQWARFHTYRSKANNTFVFNFTPNALGFEVYWGASSTIVYLELGIGSLMLRFVK